MDITKIALDNLMVSLGVMVIILALLLYFVKWAIKSVGRWIGGTLFVVISLVLLYALIKFLKIM